MIEALRWLVLAIATFAMNFPVLATLTASLKSEGELTSSPALLPAAPTLENYRAILTLTDRFDIFHFLWNSVAASGIGAALALLLGFPAAYAMVRFGTGQRILVPLVVNLRAVPLIVFAIPIYLMYQQVALLDTRLGLGLILCLVNLPLVVLLCANQVRSLPIELEEAARVDGASTVALLLRVVVPVSWAVIASTCVLSFIYGWNEFLFGLILTTREAVPVTVGASFFFAASGGGVRWGVAAAVMILATLPPLLLGLVMYRHVGRSLMVGAVKS